MKKLLILLSVITFITGCSLFTSNDRAGDNGDCMDPFVMHWGNTTSQYTLEITGGTEWDGSNPLKPEASQKIGPGIPGVYAVGKQWNIDITCNGEYVGTADVNYAVDGGGNGYVYDKNNFLKFNYNNDKSQYTGDCSTTWRYMDIVFIGTPSVIPNAGWSSGMGNTESSLVVGDSYWGIDFNPTRWSVSDDAAYVTTEPNQYNGYGGRAFPFKVTAVDPCLSAGSGIGNAMDGLWQIEMYIGSDGGVSAGPQKNGFCETFYLAERKDLVPGVNNYLDGQGGGHGAGTFFGREIDIMETLWQPEGPQASLANDKNGKTWWSKDSIQNQMMGKWADVGGVPGGWFTFGCLIRDNSLWIYAYDKDGKWWYSSGEVPNKNTEYKQEGVFVPYIGTWRNGSGTQDFKTGYRNFVYLSADDPKIAGKNPLSDKDAFGPVLN